MMNRFDDIRPYNDDEVNGVIHSLIADPGFMKIVEMLYPKQDVREKLIYLLKTITSVEEFQKKIIIHLLEETEKKTTSGISFSAMEQFRTDGNYLFISNHRDIILDSAFLNFIMDKHDFRKTEIAIGDNLLIYDWIEKLVKINRSFIVKRNLGLREQLESSKKLSSYIRYAITRKGESVWIAQKEGRTKDGNDQTQQAILKMLNMSNEGSLLEGFFELNIVPMAISYEIEPCAISKVEELLNRKYNPDFEKTQKDDLKSMANGFMSQKGRIHFSFGNPLNYRLVELIKNKKPNEAISSISEYIDKRIYFNYKLWPNNYIAFDLLNNKQTFSDKYSEEEKEKFITRMNNEISTLNFPAEETRIMYLNMYANPVVNYLRHFG